VIDLHLHTTASDGRLTPDALIAVVVSAGLEACAVTDHDTLAGLEAAAAAAGRAGLPFVRGIEITAVERGRDVHVLGYFVDHPDRAFISFLADQRADRRRRAAEMLARLAEAEVPVPAESVFGPAADDGFAVGRPALARALVAAGHVATVNEAFDRYLADGRPAYVPRRGPSPVAVVESLLRIGAVAALAHPVKLADETLIPDLASAGMGALEVFHPDHAPADVERFRLMAERLGLRVTGGSDYHGPDTGRAAALGRVGLSSVAYADLAAYAAGVRGR
jgi:predicted metal-dependent phosphoesterase TrpH